MKFILIIYLSTISMNSGMTMTAVEFDTKATCEAAQKAAYDKFNSIGTNVKTICVEK